MLGEGVVGESEANRIETGFAGNGHFLRPALGIVAEVVNVESIEKAKADIRGTKVAGVSIKDPCVFIGVGTGLFDNQRTVFGGGTGEGCRKLEGGGEVTDKGFDDALVNARHGATDGDARPVHASVKENDAHFSDRRDAEVAGIVIREKTRSGGAAAGDVNGGKESTLKGGRCGGDVGPCGHGVFDALLVGPESGNGCGGGSLLTCDERACQKGGKSED